jgi:hypothetical protein
MLSTVLKSSKIFIKEVLVLLKYLFIHTYQKCACKMDNLPQLFFISVKVGMVLLIELHNKDILSLLEIMKSF